MFGGTFNSVQAGGDFASIGGILPQSFILKVTFNDAGTPFITGDWLRLNGTDIPYVTGNLFSNYTVGNGASDTLTVSLLTNIAGSGEQLQFTISTPGTTVANTSKSVANVNALLAVPYMSGASSVTWTNSANGLGYSGSITAVPEPATMGLLLGAVAAGGYWQRRRRAKVAA